jgi:hypothetical protein
VVFGLALLAPGPLLAAEVKPVAGAVCTVKLSGKIAEGDTKRLKLLTGSFDHDGRRSTLSGVVCLDSPGGNFFEGVALARYFYEYGIATVIEPSAKCFSVCAVAFMMGTTRGMKESLVNRRLYPGAQLGFHRPSLVLPPNVAVNSRDITRSYDLAVTSVADFLDLANRPMPGSSQPMIASDLVQLMFAHKGADLFMIDSAERAARWRIELVGGGVASAE